jgi:hypothetical protein
MNGTGASRKSSILLGKICPGTKDGSIKKQTQLSHRRICKKYQKPPKIEIIYLC